MRANPGSDPGAVVYDAIEAAQARGHDVVIADTAGRLHTQVPLMEELAKVRRVIEKQLPGAPHETLLTVDATTGQNGLRQAKLFRETVDVTGIVLTKLDGTAKGGIALAIAEELELPVKLIGIGESLEDLRPFDADDYARALLESLDRALALAAHDLVEVLAVPVDEVRDVLGRELDGQREVLDEALELARRRRGRRSR